MFRSIVKLVLINAILAIGAYEHYMLGRDDIAIPCLFIGLGVVVLCQLVYLIKTVRKFYR